MNENVHKKFLKKYSTAITSPSHIDALGLIEDGDKSDLILGTFPAKRTLDEEPGVLKKEIGPTVTGSSEDCDGISKAIFSMPLLKIMFDYYQTTVHTSYLYGYEDIWTPYQYRTMLSWFSYDESLKTKIDNFRSISDTFMVPVKIVRKNTPVTGKYSLQYTIGTFNYIAPTGDEPAQQQVVFPYTRHEEVDQTNTSWPYGMYTGCIYRKYTDTVAGGGWTDWHFTTEQKFYPNEDPDPFLPVPQN